MKFDKDTLQSWSEVWPHRSIGDAVREACLENKDVIVLAADLAGAVGVNNCADLEGQFYNVGIQEQNMIGVAAGLALEGKIPIATSFAPFLTLRPYEQLRTGVGYMNLNVKLISNNAGVRGGKAGNSHYGLEDITVMRAIPGMAVLSPSDGLSMYKCIKAAVEHVGPTYVRASGVAGKKIIYDNDFDFEIGKAVKLQEGADVAILATGSMVSNAIDAIEILKGKGINPALYDFLTVKPLDKEAALEAASNYKAVICIEENTIVGGFGSAVAEVLAQTNLNPKFRILGLQDVFMKIAPYDVLLSRCGLLPEQIADTVVDILK